VTINGTYTQSVAFSVTAVTASVTRSTTDGPENVPTPPAAPPSRPSRADTLVRALDADRNGSISEREFSEGAIALLRRAAARQAARTDEDRDRGHSRAAERRHHGMAHRLERVFDRIDANHDGGVDVGELTAALAGRSGHTTETAPAPGSETAFTMVAVSVTMVAVQQYRAISQMAEPPA
jgi:hypothetical protein